MHTSFLTLTHAMKPPDIGIPPQAVCFEARRPLLQVLVPLATLKTGWSNMQEEFRKY